MPQKEMLLNVDNSVILAFCWPACGGTVAKNGPFAQRPYNGFINAVTGSILEFLALWAFISVAFGHLQGAILNAPQEEMLFTMEMRPSKEQILMRHKKKCY